MFSIVSWHWLEKVHAPGFPTDFLKRFYCIEHGPLSTAKCVDLVHAYIGQGAVI